MANLEESARIREICYTFNPGDIVLFPDLTRIYPGRYTPSEDGLLYLTPDDNVIYLEIVDKVDEISTNVSAHRVMYVLWRGKFWHIMVGDIGSIPVRVENLSVTSSTEQRYE